MEQRCDGSEVLESSLPERKESDAGSQIQEAASGSSWKIPEPETGESEDGSDLLRADESLTNPERLAPLAGLSAAEEQSLCVPKGGDLCPEAPSFAPGDPVFLDYPGGEAPPCKQETGSPLRPPDDRADAERSSEESIYSSVLHQLLQQQKHKRGRKHKKKTLMKMAKLLVVAKGWDHREKQSLSLEEESDLKEEIFMFRRREKAPKKLETSQSLPQPSRLHPDEQKEPEEPRSASAGEAAENLSPKSREVSAGSGFTQSHKEAQPQKDQWEKDPELSFKKKTGRKRIGNKKTVELSEAESPSVSPGRKEERKTDSVTHLQPAQTAAEAETDSSSGSAGKIPAPETQSQLVTGGDRLPEQNQTKAEDKVPSPDVFPKSSYGKPEKEEEKTKWPPSVGDQLPSAETSNFHHETGIKDTKTFPVTEETDDWNVMRGALSQTQDEDLIRSRKKPKGRGRRRKITQQTSNLQIKAERIWEAPTNQPDTKSADPSVRNQPDKTRKPRKRKHVEDASQSAMVTSPGAAGDLEHFVSPVFGSSEKCGSREKEDLEPLNADKPDDGVNFGKIRRSCTLGIKKSSANEEWLIRYLKGSRRKPSKGSNGKTGANPDVNPEQQIPLGTFKQTKRGRKKTIGLSDDDERKKQNTNQELPPEWDEEGFPTCAAYALDSNRQEDGSTSAGPATSESFGPNVSGRGKVDMLQTEGSSELKVDSLEVHSKAAPTTMKRGPKQRRFLKKKSITEVKLLESEEKHPQEGDPGAPETVKTLKVRRGRKKNVFILKMEEGASVQDGSSWMDPAGQTGATPEPSESNTMNLPQIEGTSDIKGDFLEVYSKMTPTKMKRGPKRKQILSKQLISDPKIQESDEKHPQEGDPGTPKVVKPPKVRRGRKKQVCIIKIEGGAPVQAGSSWMDPGGETEATPEPSESNMMNLPQSEEMSGLTGDFLEVYSKVTPTQMKRGPKRRQILSKQPISDPKIQESDVKHLQEGDPGAPEVVKPPKVRRGRKKQVLTVKIEEKSQVTSSFPDKSNTNGLGVEAVLGPEIRGKMNLLQTEGLPADPDVCVEVSSKVCNQNQTQTLQNDPAGHKIVEYNVDVLHGQDAGAAEGRIIPKMPNIRRGRKKNVFKLKMEDGAPGQDGSSWMIPGGQTSATPEPSESNTMNLPKLEGTSDLKGDFQEVYCKKLPTKMKRGPKRRQILSKQAISEPKIQESDGKHPHEGDPGNPEVGKPPKVRRGRKKRVSIIKIEGGAPGQVGSSWMDPGGETEATPESSVSNTMNLPQMEGTSDLKGDFQDVYSKKVPIEQPMDPKDFLEVHSKIAQTKIKRGPKRRRILSKPISEPKIPESEEKHPQDGVPEAPEVGKPPKVRRGRKKKVFMVKMEEGASVQDGSSWVGSERQTAATPETSESNMMNLPQIEGTSDIKVDFLEVYSKMTPTKMKRGPKRKQILSKQPISDPKIQESDYKHSQEGDPGTCEVGKPPKVRRGRKKKICMIKMEEGSSVQDTTSWMEPESQTEATLETSKTNVMNLPQIEGTSNLKSDFLDFDPKMVPTKMMRGPKRRRISVKQIISEPKILESDVKHPQEEDPGTSEVGQPPKVRRGRKKKVFMVKMEDEVPVQDTTSWMDPGSQTRVIPEASELNTMNLPHIEQPMDPKEDFLEYHSKIAPTKIKRGPKRRRILSQPISEPKILESEEKHPQDGVPEAPGVGKPPKVRRGRKKKVFMVKMEEGASVQDGSSWVGSERQTAVTPETSESNMMNLPQIEGTSDIKDDFLEVYSKVTPTKIKRGPKRKQILSKQQISEPKIQESDYKHPQEGDPRAPKVVKPPKVRRGRKKQVSIIKIEGGAPGQVGSSWMDPGGETEATPESSISNTMNLPQIEGTSDLNFQEVYSKIAPIKMKRGPKISCILSTQLISDPKILESDYKRLQEGDPGTPEVGQPPKVRRGRKKKICMIKMEEGASVQDTTSWMEPESQTEATLETSKTNVMNLPQIEGTSNLKSDFLDFDPKMVRTKMMRGPKRRRISVKQSISEPKIIESDEKHTQKGDTEVGQPPKVRRGRKKKICMIEMEEGSSVQDTTSWMDPVGQTRVIPEASELNTMNLPHIEQPMDPKEDFLEDHSKIAPTKIKRGPKRRRILSKPISEPKIPESEEKHPQDGVPEAPGVGKPPKVRRGRKKKVFMVKMEEGASVQDGSSWVGSESQTAVTPETSESNMMNLPQIEGTSDIKVDFLEVYSKMTPTKMKRGPKRKQILSKQPISDPKIQESDYKHSQEGDPGTCEVGKPPKVRRGRKKQVCITKIEGGAPGQVGSSWMDPGGETEATPEFSISNTMNLPQIEGSSDLKDYFQEVYSKITPTKMKRGPKRRQILSKQPISEPKIQETEEKHPQKGDPGAPEVGKPPKVRRGRKKKVLKVKMKEEAPFQVGSSWMDPGGQTGLSLEPSESNTMNLPQIEGTSDLKYDFLGANSKVTTTGTNQQSIAEPKMEEEAPRLTEMENPQVKAFQESVSAAPRKTTRRRRRRCKTHWSGDKKAKKPRTCSFWDVPAFPASCEETFNIQHGNLENRKMTSDPSGPEISLRLQERNKKKRLQCSFCLRSFRHISALTLHRRLHTGRKPYGCAVCSRSFSRLSQLKLHSKVHSEPPAARCPCCEETFRDKNELLAHLRVHLNKVERPRRELGGSRVSPSSADQDKSFRCSVCSKEFTKKSTFEKHRLIHGRKPRSSGKTLSEPKEVRGFLVSRLGDAAVATPVFFKCPICRQVHRHWCHYVLHLQSHTSEGSHGCDECRQDYSRPAGNRRHCSVCCRASGEEKACAAFLKDVWEEGGASGRNDQQTTRLDAENEGKVSAFPEKQGNAKTFVTPPSPSGSGLSAMEDLDIRSLNSSFSSVSDPSSKQAPRFHPEPPRLSWRSCFGRWGRGFPHRSRRGPRQRLPNRALRCSRCELEFHFLGSYMDHLREHDVPLVPRRQPDSLTCSACGKLFSTPKSLRKHKLLHKGSRFHICLPCGRSFSRHSALKAHLEAHRRRLSVPQPAPVEEPFLFPYPCRKCSARFSSTELLEAHQVCHSVAGRKPENPPESILSFIPVMQRVDVSPSGPKRKLPVSNRKDLFRYPHPDHLYVVPDISEPPLVVSDEEPGDPPPGESAEAELELQLLVQSLIPEKRSTSSSDSSDSESETIPRWTSCAICSQTFVDITTLHEHYRNHAGGM